MNQDVFATWEWIEITVRKQNPVFEDDYVQFQFLQGTHEKYL